MTGNDSYDQAEERRLHPDRSQPAGRRRWSWLLARPHTPEQVVGTAAASAGASFVTSVLLGRGAGGALAVAAGFGGSTLLVQGLQYRRWDRRGRPDDPPPNLPPYGRNWPPEH